MKPSLRNIRRAVARHNIKLAPNRWGVQEDRGRYVGELSVCPLGSLLLGTVALEGPLQDAARLIGKTDNWIEGYTDGFDGAVLDWVESLEFRQGNRVGKLHRRLLSSEIGKELT